MVESDNTLVGYSAGGCLASIFIGIIGAYLGVWLARELSLPILFSTNVGTQPFPIIWSIIGSIMIIFAAILGLINRSITGRRR